MAMIAASRNPRKTNSSEQQQFSELLAALAIHCDQLIRDGVVADQTALAKRLKVSQPRMTQIMNLTQLSPDLQEALLFLPPTECGREPIHEKMLRSITAELDWNEQRRLWDEL